MTDTMKNILGEEKISVKVSGHEYDVRPLTARKLIIATKFFDSLNDIVKKSIPELIRDHGENFISFIAASSDIEPETLLNAKLVDVVNVADAVMDMNKDFFLAIQKTYQKWSGQKSSSSLLKKVTTSRT
ncbi:MAG TPA: hypothetical protein PLO52_01470 [Flavobacterium alvei]|nr:hypothetical protein [Flavobacterium alvei]